MYHYDVEGRLIAESNQKGAMLKEYLWLDGELIAAAEGGGLFFVHANHRNEPALVTNGNGTEVWKNVTAPFGIFAENYPKVAETYRNFTLNLRLPGQYSDAETGNHYNGLRDYSPELGRYLQADPIGLNGGMNLYAYCGGDPVNRKDERGLGFEDDDYQDSYGGLDNSGLDGMEDLDENDGALNSGGDNGVEVTVEVDTKKKAGPKKDYWEIAPPSTWKSPSHPTVESWGKDPLAAYRSNRHSVQIVSSPAFRSLTGLDLGLNHVGVYDPWSGKYFDGTTGSKGKALPDVKEAPDFVETSPKTTMEITNGMTGEEVVQALSEMEHIFNEGIYGYDFDINLVHDPVLGPRIASARRNICHDQLAAGFAELGLEYPGTADGLVDWDEFFEELPGNIIDALSKIFGGF